jgi:lipopolysaccharide export system permease protein
MLNIKQLRESQDSIKSQIKSKNEDFIRNFPGNYFYLSKKYDTTKSDSSIADTVILWEDDVLSSFKEEERNALVESALSTARNIKTNISYHEDYFDSKERLIRKHNIEWHRKFTLSAACLILFFIGAPLGAIIRKGGLGLPLVISILFFLFYHILTTMGYKYAKEGVMDPGAGMWLASVVFLPVGIFLTLKATTDAPVFDADVWKKFLNKYFSGFRMMLKKK